MKKLLRILAFFSMFLVLISGCSDDEEDNPVNPGPSGSNSVTLDGGGFSNSSLNILGATGGYSSTEGQTYIMMYGMNSTDTLYVYVAFDGQGTGTKTWEGVDTISEKFSGALVQTVAASTLKFYVPVSGTTQVSAYGNVGQKITGTFNGSLIEATSLQQVTINGKFDVVRIPDE